MLGGSVCTKCLTGQKMLTDDFGKVACREEQTECPDMKDHDRAKYPNIEQAGKGNENAK